MKLIVKTLQFLYIRIFYSKWNELTKKECKFKLWNFAFMMFCQKFREIDFSSKKQQFWIDFTK